MLILGLDGAGKTTILYRYVFAAVAGQRNSFAVPDFALTRMGSALQMSIRANGCVPARSRDNAVWP